MEAQVTLARDGLSVLYYGFVSLVIALLVKVVVNAYGRLEFGRFCDTAETTSPTSEVPKTEEQKAAQEPEKVTNGEASVEEVSKPEPVANPTAKPEDESKPAEEQGAAVVAADEPKISEPIVEKPAESAPSPVKEEVPPAEEPAAKAEEPKSTESVPVEENKEVRSEEVPPPLPSSNPPSPVTVFAESTKADALPADQVPLDIPPSVPVTETVPEPVVLKDVESVPQAIPSVDESVSKLESVPVVEGNVESVSPDSSLISEQIKVDESVPCKPESSETDLNPSLTESALPAVDSTISSTVVSQSNDTVPIETVKEPTKEPEAVQLAEEIPQPETLPVEGGIDSQQNIIDQKNTSESKTEIQSPAVAVESICEVVAEKGSDLQAQAQSPLEKPIQLEPSSEEQASELLTEKSDSAVVPPSTEVPESPLAPTSPPPSPVTASTQDSCLPDPVVNSPDPTLSLQSEQAVSPTEEVLPEPVTEQLPEPISESVVNADSLPDISTESLPSLPEPVSENLAEPMSLPPVDSVPEPIASDSVPHCPVSDVCPLPSDSLILTNGNANGLPSPVDEVSPRKQSLEMFLMKVRYGKKLEIRQSITQQFTFIGCGISYTCCNSNLSRFAPTGSELRQVGQAPTRLK
ncbi:hypothetical protein NQ315_017251 [Exocentrus adspersus]|uniref:Uncharacterized protein n=1 Tax=Exocentrus adspersus TaxID=1586481 RepID=A0AAV8VG80_9CUCU|nr:hypothetical protein NQ315_017251 [Exocentrus adspersus]